MTLYKNQLNTTTLLSEFLIEMKTDLCLRVLEALKAYDGFHEDTDYDDYLIFYVDTLEDGKPVWAITKIIDQWQPVEVNDRIRKFTVDEVWEYDSYVTLSFI